MEEYEQIRIKDYQTHFPPLGEGAFGRVYRATYRGISDRALKIFRPGAVDLSTMARELEKLSKVAEHQGIVTLHDFDLLHDPPYYAMGLHADQGPDGTWETRTLERLTGKVDHREGWRLIRDTADAVAYLHRNQIIHCDIKPSNILLTDESPYHIKICDFGQSRGFATEEFDPVGTPLYASPEQLRNPRDSAEGKGFRWDVYSFGVVSFKLLTGQLPRLQGLADAEDLSFDPDSTLAELSLESTLTKTGNEIDSDQLATLTEAVDEITWPADLYVPSAKKELIQQCLSLEPNERPADMREVWGRIQRIDQQDVVKRARRLNTIFATLLVIAIWASGFAFVQAQKARKATIEERVAKEESEKSAGAAFEIMELFVNELNNGDFSGDGSDRLHSIVAENASTFLSNRFKNRVASTPILKLSAATAIANGRQALEAGELEEALQHFTNAYEIRSELYEDPNSPADSAELARLTSRDLGRIGKIHELKGEYPEAIDAYSRSLEWRLKTSSSESSFTLSRTKDLATTYRTLGLLHFSNSEPEVAIKTIDELLQVLDDAQVNANSSDLDSFQIEKVRALELKGSIEYSAGDPDAASETFQTVLALAGTLNNARPEVVSKARTASVDAIHALGVIELDLGQLEGALALFRQEIDLRIISSKSRPYDAELKITLARAYSFAAQCLDQESPTARDNAIFYFETAIRILGGLPPEFRNREDIQANIIAFNDSLSSLHEMDE
ncbi:serine/threonine-protein kinase [Verrucomicrobiales bacterium]|nr:serine/threonine-protein kinase [Verrucomicrobiales bacterium]